MMKTAAQLSLALLAVAILAVPLFAQEKVAEGEYRAPNSDTSQKHWVLTTRPSGGYLLRSEIQSPANGTRVLQLEELDDKLVAGSIGFELYLKGHTEPDVVVNCAVANNSITCDGKSEKGPAGPSIPYRYEEPFLFSVQDLTHFDFAWLVAGALNMSHLTSGKTRLRTIHVAGGAALELTDDINVAALRAVTTPKQELTVIRPENYTPWQIISDDQDVETLVYVGVEEMQLSGTNVAAQHYSLATSGVTLHFWTGRPGVLLQVKAGEQAIYVLTDYRQYRRFIPELKVDDQPNPRWK